MRMHVQYLISEVSGLSHQVSCWLEQGVVHRIPFDGGVRLRDDALAGKAHSNPWCHTLLWFVAKALANLIESAKGAISTLPFSVR